MLFTWDVCFRVRNFVASENPKSDYFSVSNFNYFMQTVITLVRVLTAARTLEKLKKELERDEHDLLNYVNAFRWQSNLTYKYYQAQAYITSFLFLPPLPFSA